MVVARRPGRASPRSSVPATRWTPSAATARSEPDPSHTKAPPEQHPTHREETIMSKRTINPWNWSGAAWVTPRASWSSSRTRRCTSPPGFIDANGQVVHVGDIAGQARKVMENIEAVLSAAGMTLADVVNYDIYATDLQDYFFNGGHEQVAKRFAQAGNLPAGGIAARYRSWRCRAWPSRSPSPRPAEHPSTPNNYQEHICKHQDHPRRSGAILAAIGRPRPAARRVLGAPGSHRPGREARRAPPLGHGQPAARDAPPAQEHAQVP